MSVQRVRFVCDHCPGHSYLVINNGGHPGELVWDSDQGIVTVEELECPECACFFEACADVMADGRLRDLRLHPRSRCVAGEEHDADIEAEHRAEDRIEAEREGC